jgi:hypothetical protein
MATTESEAPPRAFTEVLKEVESGFLVDELSETFADVVQAVRRQGKAGSLTVTLNVKPITGNDEMVTIAAGVRTKLPAPDRAPSTFFVARDGSPSRNHPSQLTDPALQPPRRDDEEPSA